MDPSCQALVGACLQAIAFDVGACVQAFAFNVGACLQAIARELAQGIACKQAPTGRL
jgi:hypothetical protein